VACWVRRQIAMNTSIEDRAGLPPLIDRDVFFGEIVIGGAQLSPDGGYISFLKPHKGARNIWVKKASEPFSEARPLTADSRPITHYFWSRDSRYILYVQDDNGDENYNIYAVDPAAPPEADKGVPPARNLTNIKGARAFIYSLPKTRPEIIYVGLNDRDASWPDLYELNITSGERKLLRRNTERIAEWVFDNAANLRLASRVDSAGNRELLGVDAEAFIPVYSCSALEICAPVRFERGDRRAYLITNKGDDRDLIALATLDPQTGEVAMVEQDPLGRVDLEDAMFSEQTDELLATIYEDDRERIYWKDAAFEGDHRWLEKQFPGREIAWVSRTRDEKIWIISAHGDTEPGEVYLFDRTKRRLALQYRVREQIPREPLAPRRSLRYASSDGLEIPAYLTLPKGIEPDSLPTIVLVHGGPWARDSWGYDPLAQFLANRGYAVLQPNFRGSTGFGKKFLNAGNGEWGRKMQDDLTWGVKHLLARGIADPKRIGIVGGSYGGYAALAGAAFTPDLYAAAVSIVGPSNLITLLESIPPYWEAERKTMYARMADPDTPEGRQLLEKESPLHAASQIRTPLMVVQGANDPRVKKRESDQIVVALRERGIAVEYLVAPDEGHGFAHPINNLAVFAAIERFLGKHLASRYQESMPPDVAARLQSMTVDPATVKLAPAMDTRNLIPPQPVCDLRPGIHRYRATLDLGGQRMSLEVASTIEDNGETWSAKNVMETPMGPVIDAAKIEKRTLVARERQVAQGPLSIDLTYDGSRAQGTLAVNGEPKSVNIQLDGPIFADSAGAMESLAALPLVLGYKTAFWNLDLARQKPKLMQLLVAAEERVTVPAGSFDTARIEVEPADGSAGKLTVWIAQPERKAVKYQAVLAEMGGAVLTAELCD
jgi:dipeptidyl aminopeptidase/acylaminoacyl peptidase